MTSISDENSTPPNWFLDLNNSRNETHFERQRFCSTAAHHLQHRLLRAAAAEQRLQGQRLDPHHPVPHSLGSDDAIKVSTVVELKSLGSSSERTVRL